MRDDAQFLFIALFIRLSNEYENMSTRRDEIYFLVNVKIH